MAHKNPIQLEIEELRHELRRERESRKKAEQQYADLLRLRHENPSPIIRFDEHGALLSANAASIGLVNMLLDGGESEAPVAEIRSQVRETARTRTQIKSTICFKSRYFDFFTVPFGKHRYVNAYFTDTTDRENAEVYFKESQKLVQRIANTIPQLVCLMDLESRAVVFHNGQLEKVTGYSPEDLKTLGWDLFTNLLPEEELAALQTQLYQLEALDDGQVHESTLRIRHKSGDRRWIRVRSVSFKRTEDGRLQQILVTAEDKTEKVEVAQLLQQQKDFYETILDSLPDTIAVLDADYRYLYVNKASIKNPEIRQGIIGKTDFEYCTLWNRPLEIAQNRTKNYQLATSLKTKVEWEEGLLTPQGQKVHHVRRVLPVLTDGENIKYLIGTGFDITERKQNEDKIRLFHSVIDHTKDGVMILELGTTPDEDKIVYVNPAFTAVTQYQPEEIVGRVIHFKEIIQTRGTTLNSPELENTLINAYQRREAVEAEFINHKKDRTPYWLSLSMAPTFDASGKATHMVIGQRDISERKKAEEKIKQSAQNNKAIIQALPDSLLVVSADGVILDKNEVEKSLPLLPSQRRGESLFLAAPADFRQKMEPILAKVLQKGCVELFEYDLGQGSNSLNFELRLIPYKKGEVLIIIRDITQKKKSMRELQEQKELIRLVLDSNPNLIFVKDAQCQYQLANRAMADMMETPLEKLNEQQKLIRRIHPEENAQFLADDLHVIQTLQQIEKEEVFTSPSGRKVLLHTVKKPLHRADGTVQVLGISTDITEIKQAREDLNKRQALYRLLSDNSRDIICLHDTAANYLYISRSMRDVLGYDPAELIGSSPFRFIHPDDAYPIREKLENSLHETLELTVTMRFMHKNGTYVCLETIAKMILDEYGKPMHLQTSSRDITERKKAEEIILQSEKRYRNLVNYSQAIICSHDLEGKIISTNPSLQRILGYREDEILNTFIQNYIPAGHRTKFDQYLAALADNNQKEGITCVLDREGKRRYLLSQAFKVEERDMKPYIITFAQDITDRLLAENELKKAKIAAEESARAKENFLANMSHEIRTPMNGVIGMTSLLSKTALSETQESYVKNIRTSSQNLLVIINDILDMAKIESGKMELEKIPFNLADTVRTALASQAYRAEEKDLVLRVEELPETNTNLIGDPFRLHQILLNLLSNALKFTERGSVSLSCRFVSENKGKVMVAFKVKDTGIGIPEGKLKMIFDGFTQAYANTSRKYGGTGLGLAICRRLIERQGGRIWVTSKLNEGSEFGFTLPFELAPEPVPQEQEKKPLAYNSMAGKHILLAEDNEINQFLAKAILTSWGCQVRVASNGQEAVQALDREDFDLVLMDIQMPVMNGLEATEHIRKLSDPRKAGIPIIALTANALKGEEEKYLATGLSGYLSKPFEEDQLFLIMSEHLHGRPGQTGACPGGVTSAAAWPAPEPVTIDFGPLKKMCSGDAGFYTKMLELFLELVPGYLDEINAGLKREDWASVGALAHKLKPNIDTLAITDLKENIRLLEQYGKKKTNLSEIPDLVRTLNQTLGDALTQIQQELTQFRSTLVS